MRPWQGFGRQGQVNGRRLGRGREGHSAGAEGRTATGAGGAAEDAVVMSGLVLWRSLFF